jgi:hypothetical protein
MKHLILRISLTIALLIGALPIVSTSAGTTVPAYQHVFFVIMENHARAQIIGKACCPYINSLASADEQSSNYFAVSHPSLPNYMALSGGAVLISQDCTNCTTSATPITQEMDAAGKSWAIYMDGATSNCDLGNSTDVDHDPFVHYTSIRNNTAYCDAHVLKYTQLASDLTSATTTRAFTWITPNDCHNMHSCKPAKGDAWLKANLPIIFASPAWTTQHSLLVLTWDEDDGSHGNNVAFIAVSSDGTTHSGGYISTVKYNHYSWLKTLEVMWNLAPLQSNDSNASAMYDLFQ